MNDGICLAAEASFGVRRTLQSVRTQHGRPPQSPLGIARAPITSLITSDSLTRDNVGDYVRALYASPPAEVERTLDPQFAEAVSDVRSQSDVHATQEQLANLTHAFFSTPCIVATTYYMKMPILMKPVFRRL